MPLLEANTSWIAALGYCPGPYLCCIPLAVLAVGVAVALRYLFPTGLDPSE